MLMLTDVRLSLSKDMNLTKRGGDFLDCDTISCFPSYVSMNLPSYFLAEKFLFFLLLSVSITRDEVRSAMDLY
jgi:hypothetical protein